MSRHRRFEMPPCGLYRTGQPLPTDDEDVPAGILVMFHNHSNRGIPMLQLPEYNHNNTWTFQKYGPGIEEDDFDFIEALEPLREQGLYFLGEDLETPDQMLPRFTLVQLGYDLEANPIIFPAEQSPTENAVLFPEVGYRFESLEILEILRPAFPLTAIEETEESIEEEESPTSNLLN